jgi:DNA-binding beta-propeller fold protein YncE
MSQHVFGRFVPLALIVGAVSSCTAEAREGSGAQPHRAYAPGYTVQGGVVQAVNYLPNPYETVRDFGRLPDGRRWGSVSAIHVDIDGRHIWAGDRCGTNSCAGSTVDPIVKMDPDGNVVQSFGAGMFIWPHGVHVDRAGNIWVTDARGATDAELEQFPGERNKGHAVYKFSPRGELLLTLGTPGVRGDGTGALLAEPNDVIIAPNGDIFVAEAHSDQNSDVAGPNTVARIAKFSSDGTYLMSFGQFGTGSGELRGPHALALDSQGRLFVADRGNNRIQIFDQEGNLLDIWHQFSRISGLVITPDDILYAIDSESSEVRNPGGWRKGLRIGSARTGEVWYFVGPHDSATPTGGGGLNAMGEGVTVDAQGNVYAGEVGAVQGVTKFIPRLLTVQH